ncbi:hypothetical protein C8035_v000683 [Colletotrichum spinosum]|uniref:Uncharacterized protein n=1 Tax=Colletotrichum spinosum TaxID=1347390 RepID=A0A4R8Q685_9PEZI|nr:hypothetical protein C8035_v000683 [Colletotrichum spinosum]
MWLLKVATIAAAVAAAGLQVKPLAVADVDADLEIARRQLDATSRIIDDFNDNDGTGGAYYSSAAASAASSSTTTDDFCAEVNIVTSTTAASKHTRVSVTDATTSPSSAPPTALPAQTTSAAPTGGGALSPPPAGQGAQVGGGPPVQRLVDPSKGAFIGGDPSTNIDVPVTFLFLLLFSAGAYTHIRIYRANAKRGHKFLLSDLMFDFCMVRNVTCIMRIVWAFEKARGVILAALIVQFGGAVVIMVVNIFFAQRIIRSIHPNFGWHPFFGVATLFFIFSVPAVILSNSTSLGVSFFNIEDQDRVETALNVLKAGVSWIMLLAILPIVAVLFAAVIPGPKPERFGTGDTHQKIAVLFIGAIPLIAGHAVRLTSTLNPEPPGSTSRLLSREVFYTTGFMLEIFVVVFYAVARIDLLFHVPNGSAQPGDYARRPKPGEDDYEAALLSRHEIEDEIAALGHPYEIVDSSGLGRDGSGRTIVAFSTRRFDADDKPVVLPPRPQAYSRVQSIRGSVRSVRGSLRSARGGLTRMMSSSGGGGGGGRMTPAPYLNHVDVNQPAFTDNPFGQSRMSQYGLAQPLFIQSRFSRYTDPDDERSALRPESQATSGEIPLSLDRDGLGPDEGRFRNSLRRSSIQKFTAQERGGGPLK